MKPVSWLKLGKAGGFVLQIAAQPNARTTEVVGVHDGALKIKVASPPVDGAANEALVAFLASTLGLKQRDIRLVRGESGRRKTVELPVGLAFQEIVSRLSPSAD